MGQYRGLDTGEGWQVRAIADLQRQIDEQAAARRLVVSTVGISENTPTYDQGQTITLTNIMDPPLLAHDIPVPPGFTSALVQLFVGAGTYVDGNTTDSSKSGTIIVQPVVNGIAGPPQQTGRMGGGYLSVFSGLTRVVPTTTSVQVFLWASKLGTGSTPLSDYVTLSATVLFTRA